MDLTGAAWRTSSYSGGNGGQCVQVATIPGPHDRQDPICTIRDSKNTSGPALGFGRGPWQQFTTEVKAGTFGPS
ncbi:MAG: DUF397 domain-containing protein [Streptosporangiaceae bacterium]